MAAAVRALSQWPAAVRDRRPGTWPGRLRPNRGTPVKVVPTRSAIDEGTTSSSVGGRAERAPHLSGTGLRSVDTFTRLGLGVAGALRWLRTLRS